MSRSAGLGSGDAGARLQSPEQFFVGLSIAGALVLVSARGQQYTKVVDLIVTQPLGRTPVRTLTVVAAANSSRTAATSPRTSAASGAVNANPGSPGSALHIQAAEQAAQAASNSSTRVGFAVFDSSGQELGSYDDTMENYGASITKSMLLVAYLRQVGSRQLTPSADQLLTNMIEVSDNESADAIWSSLQDPALQVQAVASDAGMTGFELNDTADSVYVLGQSMITARDFALFFSRINLMIPGARRSYGLSLLSNLAASDQVGLLRSGLPGTVYSKEGWKGEPTITGDQPYVVNQAAQFQLDGRTYGVAVTVAQNGGSETSNEEIIQRIGAALIG